jgi:hypothetical protein
VTTGAVALPIQGFYYRSKSEGDIETLRQLLAAGNANIEATGAKVSAHSKTVYLSRGIREVVVPSTPPPREQRTRLTHAINWRV